MSGTLVSLTGVVLARIVAPIFNGNSTLLVSIYLLGITLGLAGLVLLTFGMTKVYRNVGDELEAGKKESN
ncbi:hypothetical protein, partial [Pelotomaculum sp. PtaB.Bin117]|uniref:hypothetical protein n=1 Tax=Pelotomaculum sp. PtaB.Bin117 TaxID=1811694 RepID=UPI0025805B00